MFNDGIVCGNTVMANGDGLYERASDGDVSVSSNIFVHPLIYPYIGPRFHFLYRQVQPQPYETALS